MKTKIKKIAALAVVLACLAVGVQSTIAYFSTTDTATNVITMGNIKIKLHEQRVGNNEDGTLEPFEDVVGVVPGDSVSKIVTVENTGNNPAWVRISLEKAISLAEGVEGEINPSLVTFDIGDDWVERDGWYYYTKVLNASETTTAFFNNVIFSENMSNMYQDSTVTVSLLVHATQTAHNGTSVWEADGWPTVEVE